MVFKSIRNVSFINWFVRIITYNLIKILNWASFRWRVSGKIKLQFDSINFFYFTKADDAIADCLFYKKDYVELYDLSIFVELSKKMEIILDAGANTGIYSILTAIANPSAAFFRLNQIPSI